MIDPPYPADLEAKGWALDLDYEKIDQSETWPIAAAHPADEGGFTPELRPWLLMTWLSAWKQVPIASFPQNDRLIAAIIGMPVGQFIASKDVLLSGFEAATDGRMYHRTLSACALKMASKRDKDRARVAAFRAKSHAGNEALANTNEPVAASNAGVEPSNALQEQSNNDVAACNALPTRDQHVSSAPLPTPLLLPQPTPTPTPELPRPEQKQSQKKEQKALALSRPESVPEKVWADFLKLRSAKKAPLTETAMAGIEREAERAGITLGDCLALCCSRGWQSFNSGWDWRGTAGQRAAPQNVRDAVQQAVDDVDSWGER